MRCDQRETGPEGVRVPGRVSDSATGSINVWVSAMDSAAGVITLSAAVDSSALGAWRRDLEQRYGRVAVQRQGGQSMQQWVRRGRMLRLTWRTERGELHRVGRA